MNTNLIEGIILLTIVLAFYNIYFVKGDKNKLKDASMKGM